MGEGTQVTVLSREIKSDFPTPNCSEFLIFKHLGENEVIRLCLRKTNQQSHLISAGRVTDLRDGEGDIDGKDVNVDKPLDIEIIWEFYSLKRIWQKKSF